MEVEQMGKPLSVLLIEDSEDDATLIVHELEHGGYDVDYERVDTTASVRNALGRRKWDVILSDHAMPESCALEALSVVKEIGIDLPFIIVSGWMTDELAKSAIKEGARGFVPKNRLARLVPVIEAELKKPKGSKKKPAKKRSKGR
jgi:DNA-binding NtrC family response regulator